MASKLCILSVFIVLVLTISKAEAQLLGGSGGLVGTLLGLINIKGTVFCTLDGNMGVNGTATPVFSNALVQLKCGGDVVSSTTTNSGGIFSIVVDTLQLLLQSLTNCNIAVITPLSNCNVNLPSVGGLVSPLQFVGSILQGFFKIVNFEPSGFQFLPHILN